MADVTVIDPFADEPDAFSAALAEAGPPPVPVAPAAPPAASVPPVAAPPAVHRPKPEAELTPEEREIRNLKDQLARANARVMEERPDEVEELVVPTGSYTAGTSILIHILEDGFTALGRVWYRGQQIEFDLEGEPIQQTRDRNGRSWLDDSEMDQARRYGRVYWRRGPWPGDTYADQAAAEAERRRGTAAPVMRAGV